MAFPTTGQQPWGTDLKGYIDGKVSVGWTNHSIMEYAAGATINDGVTSASAAITAALAAIPAGGRQRLWLPPGIYLDDLARNITKGVEIVGDGATIKKGPTVVAGNWWLLNAADIHIEGLIFDDGGGAITGIMLAGANLMPGLRIRRCTATAPAANITMFTHAGANPVFEDNVILACRTGIELLGAVSRPEVRGNQIKGWTERGLYAEGDAAGATTDLKMIGNTISDMAAGGVNRRPISTALATSPTMHLDALFEGNIVHGAGKSYTAADPGNADCFGLFAIDGVRILGNAAEDGGDMGITVDGTCANVTFAGNVSRRNDSGGIAVSGAAKGVSITGNVCKNNGQNRNGDRVTSLTGIWLNNAVNVVIAGNVLGDDQGVKTQQWGVNMTGSTNVSLGPDIDAGNAVALYVKNGAANVNIVKATTAAF